MPLAGRPMVEWSLAALRACPAVGAIVVACPPGHAHELQGGDGPGGDSLPAGELTAVDGGETRAASVANALAAVESEVVAIHDAARPLLTAELAAGVLATLAADPAADGAIAAAPVTDTVKRASGEGAADRVVGFDRHSDRKRPLVVESTLDRGRLWAAQTPQAFRTEALRRALREAERADPQRLAAATDEASLVEAAGGRVLIHPAPPENLKVTTAFDLRVAELLLAERGA